jgi:hypothetical protein
MTRLSCLLFVLAASPSFAQPLQYQQPPEAIRAVLDAKPLPARVIDPTGKTLAIAESRRYPAIEQLSRPFLRLAGMRFDPASSSPHRTQHLQRLAFRALVDPAAPERLVPLPGDGDFYNFGFSPDGRRFTLLRRTTSATELWVGDVATARAAALPGVAIQNIDGGGIDWLDADTIIVRTVPAKRGAAPAEGAPVGPVVQESFGRKSPEPTFQDLLRSPRDAALYEHYATCELTRIDLVSGNRRVLAPAALYAGVSAFGDGRHVLLERIAKPYSYSVPHYGFGREVLVIDREGRVAKELARVALRENVPVQGVIQGPRNYTAAWTNASVYWVEALDEGDPRKKVPHRDRLMMLAAPYSGAPVELAKFAQRVVNVEGMSDGRLFVTDYDRDRVWLRRVLVDPSQPGVDPAVLFDLSARDRYNDPGRLATRANA